MPRRLCTRAARQRRDAHASATSQSIQLHQLSLFRATEFTTNSYDVSYSHVSDRLCAKFLSWTHFSTEKSTLPMNSARCRASTLYAHIFSSLMLFNWAAWGTASQRNHLVGQPGSILKYSSFWKTPISALWPSLVRDPRVPHHRQ
jgi:hypothetical protein